MVWPAGDFLKISLLYITGYCISSQINGSFMKGYTCINIASALLNPGFRETQANDQK